MHPFFPTILVASVIVDDKPVLVLPFWTELSTSRSLSLSSKETLTAFRARNSQRVVHYRYENGKCIFTKHTVLRERTGTMGTAMGTERANTPLFHQNNSGRSLAWLGLRPPEPMTRVRIPAAAPYWLKRRATLMHARSLA